MVGSVWAFMLLVTLASWSHARDGAAPAPTDFSLPSITDRHHNIRLSDYRGATVYLDFWSSWCLPCRESLPLLHRLQAEFSDHDFAVVTINLDAFPGDGRKLMSELEIDLPVASDIGWRVAKQYGLEALPAAFLLDGAGRIQLQLPRLDEQSYQKIAGVIGSQIGGRPAGAISQGTPLLSASR